MNSKRRSNGEGSLYKTIKKNKRLRFDTKGECIICKDCTNRTQCNNREGYIKCQKCKDCKTECLKYCDRFYCQEVWIAQASINGKQKTLASDKKQKNTAQKKSEALGKVQNGTYVDKSKITLYQLVKDVEDEKLSSNKIQENSYNRNLFTIKHIKDHIAGQLPIQKVTVEMLKNLLNSKINMSQSEISKLYHCICSGYRRAEIKGIISIMSNPILEVDEPTSLKDKKEVIAFEIQEQTILLNYINDNVNTLVTDIKAYYDGRTIKNLVILAFLTGMRIGELGALDIDKHIDMDKKKFIVERTLTKNKQGKIILGTSTKTGKKKRKQNKVDRRTIPFGVFEEDVVIAILEEQIEIAKSNPNNEDNLLFYRLDNDYINHAQINQIFKRICREAGVKLTLPKGCNFHMTRHTFVTRCIEARMELLSIAKLTGHTSTRPIEKTYGHILAQFLDEELASLRKYYARKKIIPLRDCYRRIQTTA